MLGEMAAPGDDMLQLRRAFGAALANHGWNSPDTVQHANNLAIALWEAGHRGEAEATLLGAQENVNEDAFAQTRRGRAVLENLALLRP
jgi:hypothetical protein